MAFATGTASNYTDLLARLITFLTTNANLVSAGQNWTVLNTQALGAAGENGHLLRGPGLAGDDAVYIRLQANSVAASDIFGWSAYAFSNYNPSLAHANQPGMSPDVGMALWNGSTRYWFVANGRRFIVIAYVGNAVYSSMYLGLLLPYATPAEYPYPVGIFGSHENATTHRWSQADYNVGGFFDPSEGNAYVRHIDGTWVPISNYVSSGTARSPLTDSCVWPYDTDLNLRENLDGSYSLIATVVHSNENGGNVYGELEGVFFTSGYGLAGEDVVLISAVSYLVVPSVYRTTRTSYAAIRLE